MPDDVKTANIIIREVVDSREQVKIRDHNRRMYSFFKQKKDGLETAAFRDFQQFNMGDTVEIAYKEVPYKDGVLKNIITIRPATGPVESFTPPARNNSRGRGGGPDREYWEAREATRQNAILLQVAFKSAIEIESAYIRAGEEEDKDRLYRNTLEYYDLMASELGDGELNIQEQKQAQQESETVPFE